MPTVRRTSEIKMGRQKNIFFSFNSMLSYCTVAVYIHHEIAVYIWLQLKWVLHMYCASACPVGGYQELNDTHKTLKRFFFFHYLKISKEKY